MDISKKYSPSEIEDKWYRAWMDHKLFRSVPDDREPFTIVIPPPNVTGILHMGHILNNTIQDVLVRRKRMEGYNALWVPGTDHASIATEAKVVGLLREKGISKQDISRDKFMEYAYEWKAKYGGIIIGQLQKLGASCDWERERFTMDANYYPQVINVFCDLYDKGLIYRGLRMVNWDPKAQTAISDEEVYYQDVNDELYYIRYPIEDMPGEFITVATTRPETILGDTGVAVHPDDPRYKHLQGKRCLVPLINRSIPIIADDYIDLEFGTGCLKVTPAHDENDYQIGLRHGLEVVDTFNADGTLSEAAQLYVGEDRFVVRKKISKELEEKGFMLKREPYKHSVGFSERTHVVIEPRLSEQWFLKMKELSQPALDAVENGEVKLIPGKFVNTYRHWMENVRDWCLSRQLWWGHRIPAWFIRGTDDFVVAPSEEEALEKARTQSGNASLRLEDLRQEDDVLDTWASSWIWPIAVFDGLLDPENEDFKYYYPTNDLVTGPDILFFWVARMIIAGYEYANEKPFQNVYLTGMVRDMQHRKMSKSLGNSPDPLDLIAQYGADGVRVGMLLSAPAGNDLLFGDNLVEQGRNFANKIWNAYRLVKGWKLSDAEPGERDLMALKWMDARINETGLEIADHFDKFRISDALMSVYKLIWDDYCSWFLEMVKPPYGDGIPAKTLEGAIQAFERVLEMAHPFMPFITEEVWQGLRTRPAGQFLTVHQLTPLASPEREILDDIELIKETVTGIRGFRAEKGLSTKEAIDLFINTTTPEQFEPYFPLLERFLNTARIEFVSAKVDGAGSIRVKANELFIPMKGLDVEAEKEKLRQEITYTEGFLEQVMKKLKNEKFVNNAPPQVVDLEKQKKTDAVEKLKVLKDSLAQLG
jgi:valyl-tRNA synthetase